MSSGDLKRESNLSREDELEVEWHMFSKSVNKVYGLLPFDLSWG